MTVHSFWQQTLATNAAKVRKMSGLWWPGPDGVRFDHSAQLLVSAQPTPNMTVSVNAGWGKSGGYLGNNDAPLTATITASVALPRKDLVVMRWYDTESGAGVSDCKVEVIAGTPNAVPQRPSVVGMTVAVLAEVAVGASVTSIGAGAITDLRTLSVPTGMIPDATGAAQRDTLSKYTGLSVVRADSLAVERWDGASWSVVGPRLPPTGSGSVLVPANAGFASANFTYGSGISFATAPVVMITSTFNAAFDFAVTAKTTTGFTVRCFATGSTPALAYTPTFDWVAHGIRA